MESGYRVMHSIRRPWLRASAALLSALLLGAIAATGQAIAKTPDEVEIGQTLRDATLLGLNGPSRKLSDFRGRPLIINVWASWCGPCRQEMASLERLAWQDRSEQFAVIGISTDDHPEQAKELLRSANATISHFIDSKLLLENMLGASRLPLTVLVDANGRILDKVYGAKDWDGAEASKILAKAFRNSKAAPLR
jgi:thiol-disulfide isomerase/thioredoxin